MLCEDCREAGRAVMGFITIDGRRYCGDHAAKRGWQKPQHNKSEVQEINMKREAIDWEPIEKDLDAGMKPKEAAKQHGIPVQRVYSHQNYRKRLHQPMATSHLRSSYCGSSANRSAWRSRL